MGVSAERTKKPINMLQAILNLWLKLTDETTLFSRVKIEQELEMRRKKPTGQFAADNQSFFRGERNWTGVAKDLKRNKGRKDWSWSCEWFNNHYCDKIFDIKPLHVNYGFVSYTFWVLYTLCWLIISLLGFQDHPFIFWAFLLYEIMQHQLPWRVSTMPVVDTLAITEIANQPLQLSVALPFPLRKLFCGASGELCWWWMWCLAEHRCCCRVIVRQHLDRWMVQQPALMAQFQCQEKDCLKLCYRLWWDILSCNAWKSSINQVTSTVFSALEAFHWVHLSAFCWLA